MVVSPVIDVISMDSFQYIGASSELQEVGTWWRYYNMGGVALKSC